MIADSSAWIAAWRAGGALRASLDERVLAGAIWTTPPIVLELLRGAHGPAEHMRMREAFTGLVEAPIDEAAWQRALDVQCLLARSLGGRHRGVPPTDLLIAAAAERAGVPVLHRDRDFELIAGVTGQPVRWFGDAA